MEQVEWTSLRPPHDGICGRRSSRPQPEEVYSVPCLERITIVSRHAPERRTDHLSGMLD